MNLAENRFSRAKVAECANVKAATLQSWLNRYGFEDLADESGRTEGGGAKGRTRRFSFVHIVHFAVTGRLAASGVPTAWALNAGAAFAHTGGLSGACSRAPAMPFTRDGELVETMLCTCEKGTAIVPRVDGSDWWCEAMIRLGNPEGMFCMPVERTWQDACWKMGLRPVDVLAAVAAGDG